MCACSCGAFVASLCPEHGCHDPGTGDYDVVVPADVVPGAFSLYVEELSGEDGVWDCTPFTVSVDPSGARNVCAFCFGLFFSESTLLSYLPPCGTYVCMFFCFFCRCWRLVPTPVRLSRYKCSIYWKMLFVVKK